MDKVLSIDTVEYRYDTSSTQRLTRGYGFVSAGVLTLIGITMLTLLFLTNGSVLIKGIEVVLSLSMLVASLLMWSELMLKEQQTPGGVLLVGDLAVAASFFYLGVAIPAFHQGYVTPTFALAQFITVLIGLIAGSGVLALAGSLKDARPRGVVRCSDMVRDGVLLITGTTLFGIALSQLALADLKAPQWNWISFVGITIPGMLILVGREGLKERCEGVGGWRGVSSQLLIELLLIVGVAIMLYGSYANLTLGANGYLVGIKGNAAGFRLWLIAALLLLGARGGFKLLFGYRRDHLWYRVLKNLLYAMLLVPFIYGAHSVFAGQPPRLRIGAAWPDVVPILIAAILLLVVGRSVGQKDARDVYAQPEIVRRESC